MLVTNPVYVMAFKFSVLQLPFIIFTMICIFEIKASSRHAPLTIPQKNSDPQAITESAINNNQSVKNSAVAIHLTADEHLKNCPSNLECAKFGGDCINCTYNYSCVYGQEVQVECVALKHCLGERRFNKTIICRFCYQTESWEHVCLPSFNCRVVSNPRERELTNCTVKSEIICLGNREFRKNPLCNWTDGYKWSTALILSITLGGFGADRFYLGHWQEGIGKLFSFGGLGIWTLLDVMLIAVGYLSPADGSLYI